MCGFVTNCAGKILMVQVLDQNIAKNIVCSSENKVHTRWDSLYNWRTVCITKINFYLQLNVVTFDLPPKHLLQCLSRNRPDRAQLMCIARCFNRSKISVYGFVLVDSDRNCVRIRVLVNPLCCFFRCNMPAKDLILAQNRRALVWWVAVV